MDRAVDVLLSVYNSENCLEQLLDSLENQTYRDFRLIIRDDGSSDSSSAILERFVERTSLECHLSSAREHLGIIRSFNELMKKASADYIMYCDQDDVWLPEKIEKTINAIRKAEEAYGKQMPLLLHCDLQIVDGNLKLISPSMWRFQRLDAKHCRSFKKLLIQNAVTGCAMVINRALFHKVPQVPDDAIMHDWYLALAAAAYGRVEVLSEPLLLYRWHGANAIGPFKYAFLPSLRKFRNGKIQMMKKRLKITFVQANAFASEMKQLPAETERILQEYIRLPHHSFWERRLILLQEGFLKNGFWRNLGLVLFI